MAPSGKVIVIDTKGKAIISVSKSTGGSTDKRCFLVSKSCVEDLKLSGNTCNIDLSEDDPTSIDTMELIIRLYFKPYGLPRRFLDLPIEEVWRTLIHVDAKVAKYHKRGPYRHLDADCWFKTWFYAQTSKLTRDQYEQLLYPAFVLGGEDGKIFAEVTRWLVYNAAGQIQEQNPLAQHNQASFEAMHLPEEVICAIRGAKIALQGRFVNFFDKYKERCAQSTCPQTCRRCGPGLEGIMKHFGPYDSVEDMLNDSSLQEIIKFMANLEDPDPNDESASDSECAEWLAAPMNELSYAFDGLCLDCMSLSINKLVLDNTNSRPCNVCSWHKEMTWEHSNIGPLRS